MVRGISQLVAAASGLVLVFGATYAMDGMASRLPTGATREMVTITTFMLPWTLLFCSGLHDLSRTARREWIFWSGCLFLVAFLFFFNQYTAEARLTKLAMPWLACGLATLPHVLRRLSFAYSAVCSFIALCAIVVLYLDVRAFMSGSSFATSTIAALMVAFGLAGTIGGIFLIIPLWHRRQITKVHA